MKYSLYIRDYSILEITVAGEIIGVFEQKGVIERPKIVVAEVSN